MRFKELDICADKDRSDRTADLLSQADIRIKRRSVTKGQRTVYVIAVHPDDVPRAGDVLLEARRRESEDFVRTRPFVRRRFRAKDMLITREPNEAGYYGSFPYRRTAYDKTRLRRVRGGWDHEHYVCSERIQPGDDWWACTALDTGDGIGVCLQCRARLRPVRRQ